MSIHPYHYKTGNYLFLKGGAMQKDPTLSNNQTDSFNDKTLSSLDQTDSQSGQSSPSPQIPQGQPGGQASQTQQAAPDPQNPQSWRNYQGQQRQPAPPDPRIPQDQPGFVPPDPTKTDSVFTPLPDEPAKKKKGRKGRIILIALLSLLLIAGISALVWFQTLKKNYKEGVKAFQSQDYEQAGKSFAKASMYNNGSKLSKICAVLEEMKGADYKAAAKLAKDIDDFKVKDDSMQKDLDKIRADYYKQAEEVAVGGDPQTGVYIFQCLKDYKDSAKAASYYDATIHMNQNEMDEAITLFEEADSYKDASSLAKQCTDYRDAAALQEKGDDSSLEEADKLFSSLGDFKDSADRALACRSVKLFRNAKEKADAKDFEGAYSILNEYPNNPYPGWQDLLTESKNEIDYAEAEKYYKSENYYKAYTIYDDLGTFKDSEKKKKKCVQDTPNKSILFQDDDYKSSAVSLTFKNSGITHNYIKMYTSSDKLVARIFVKKNDSATIHLPAGSYHINKAYGNTWYGKKDMFGDAGYYTRCKVNGGYNFSLQNNYIYTMSTGSGSGDAVSGETVGSDGF